MSSRKIYSRDFKLKVLEYYFKHGGDKKFGNRAKTAHHFCIDHKTVSRMLCNADIVKKARRTLGKKNSSSGCKPPKPPSLKLMGQPFGGGIKEVGSVSDGSSSGMSPPHPGSSKASYTSPTRDKKPSSPEVSVIELPEDPDFSLLKKTIDSSASSAANIARLLLTGTKEVKRIITSECDLVFECKVCRNLFRSIINFLAHKRVYCQEEYANVKSLFHKDTGLKMSSESSTVIVEPEPPPLSPHDPRPAPSENPPCRSELKIDRIASQLASRKRKSETGVDEQRASSSTHRGSSTYFRKLHDANEERRSRSGDCSVLLQDIAGVSSAVYQTFVPPSASKASLERIGDVVNEVHQRKRGQPVQLGPDGKVMKRRERKAEPVSIPPKKTTTSSSSSSSATTSSSSSSSATRVLAKEPEEAEAKAEAEAEAKEEEEVEVVFSCNKESCSSSFCSQKLLTAHVEEVHGVERTIYTCPICNMVFLSIWGCVKHLIRIHKKKKHHRERLKHVICSRAYKKMFTSKEIAKHTHKGGASVAKKVEKKKEEEEVVAPLVTPAVGVAATVAAPVVSPVKSEGISRVNLPVEEEPTTFVRNKNPIVPHSCPRCGQTFQTPSAVSAHHQYCPLASLPNSFQSETPEKKIEIQIRKDYKKESPSVPLPPQIAPVETAPVDEKLILEIQARLKEVCVLKRLFCVPCNRKYHTMTVLKRHAAQHIGWTRFNCQRCSFRSFDKYVCSQHCIRTHKATRKSIDRMMLKDERLEKLKYYLPVNKESTDPLSLKPDYVRKKKADFLNGDYSSSSDCSASVVSDDSLSLKSEFESHDLESANVAYRELIEVVDANSSEGRSSSREGQASQGDAQRRERSSCKEMRQFRMDRETRSTSSDARELDLKQDRPQRVRKTIEQKDFVYEPLRVASTTTPLSVKKIERSVVKRRDSSPPKEPFTKRLLRNSVDQESAASPSPSICNGTDSLSPVVDRKPSSHLQAQTNKKDKSPDREIIKISTPEKKELSTGRKSTERLKPVTKECVLQDKTRSDSKRKKGFTPQDAKSEAGEDLTKESFEDQNKNVSEPKIIFATKKVKRELVEDQIKVISEDKIKRTSSEKIKELVTVKKGTDNRNETVKDKNSDLSEIKRRDSTGQAKTKSPEDKNKPLPKSIKTECSEEDKDKETQSRNKRVQPAQFVTTILKGLTEHKKRESFSEKKKSLAIKKEALEDMIQLSLDKRRGSLIDASKSTDHRLRESTGAEKTVLLPGKKSESSLDMNRDKNTMTIDKKSESPVTRKSGSPVDINRDKNTTTIDKKSESPVTRKSGSPVDINKDKNTTTIDKKSESPVTRKSGSPVDTKSEKINIPIDKKSESSVGIKSDKKTTSTDKKSEYLVVNKIESSVGIKSDKKNTSIDKKGESSSDRKPSLNKNSEPILVKSDRTLELPLEKKIELSIVKRREPVEKKSDSVEKKRELSVEKRREISENRRQNPSDQKNSSQDQKREPSEKKAESSQEKKKECAKDTQKVTVVDKKGESSEERKEESDVREKKRESLVKGGDQDKPKDVLPTTKDKKVT